MYKYIHRHKQNRIILKLNTRFHITSSNKNVSNKNMLIRNFINEWKSQQIKNKRDISNSNWV